MKFLGYKPSEIRKTIVAVLGLVLVLAPQLISFLNDLAPGVALALSSAVGVVTVVSVFLTKNAAVIDDFDDGRFGNETSV